MKKTDAARPYFQAFYKGNRLRFALTLVLMIAQVPITLVVSWILGEVIDTIAAADLARLGQLVLFTLCFAVAMTLTDVLMHRVKTDFVHTALAQYKLEAFRRLSQKSISAFSRENTGRYISVITNDTGTIEEKYLLRRFFLVKDVLLFFGTLGMMFWYNVPLTLAAIGFSLLSIFVSVPMSGELAKRETAVSDENEQFISRVKDLLSGFAVIKSFKAEKEAKKLFGSSNTKLEHTKARRRWWSCMLSVTGWDICGMLLQFGIFILGAYFAIAGEITAGTVVIFTNLCNSLLQPVQNVPEYMGGIRSARALIQKLAQVTEENAAREGDAITPVLNNAIELSHLSFSYVPGEPVLKNISLRLESGKKYALVGASGSGKSTLLNLLMGGCEGYTGSVSIDGKELSSVSPDSLYDLMSLIGQSVFLFDDTIRRNITMFRDFPEEQVQSAVQRAGLASLFVQKGEDYRCGENGVGLSGGERQRVSIARCLLRGTPVLLLDEATAALDNQTAFAVTDSILHLDGLTRLVVTHRLESELLEQYDRIFVLRNGALHEEGTFRELMEDKGYFYSLYNVSAD